MRRRFFMSLIALACAAIFGALATGTASAQASCPDYTVIVDPALAGCLPITITTFWGNPPVHNVAITATGVTIVPAPNPPGLFVAPLNRVDINGILVFPNPSPVPPVIRLLPCNLCAQVRVTKDINGCIIIRITPHPGPC